LRQLAGIFFGKIFDVFVFIRQVKNRNRRVPSDALHVTHFFRAPDDVPEVAMFHVILKQRRAIQDLTIQTRLIPVGDVYVIEEGDFASEKNISPEYLEPA
jgi:hypothetical protein